MNTPHVPSHDNATRTNVAIIAIGVALAALWYYQIWQPRNAQFNQVSTQLKEKQQQLTIIKKMRPQRDQLRVEIERKRGSLDSLKAIFPDAKEIPRLIHDITRLTQSSEILTTRFNPLKDEVREYYIENHFSVALQGTYHNFALFLSSLANLRLIVNLSEMRIDTHRLVGGRALSPEEFDELPYTIMATFKMTTFSSKN